MAIRGQRFEIDLDSDQEHVEQQPAVDATPTRSPWSLIGDIQERSLSAPTKPPSPPKIKTSQNGFPTHQKRSKFSRMKQEANRTCPADGSGKRSLSEATALEFASSNAKQVKPDEKQEIDMENRKRIAEMSPEDIDQARKELMTGLSPSFIERLLRRANIEEDQNAHSESRAGPEEEDLSSKVSSDKKVAFDIKGAGTLTPELSPDVEDPAFDPEGKPIRPPPDLQPVSTFSGYPAPPSFHFPRPPTPPSLDPEDPEFLSKLHSTYFPSLPSNPNALSWMQPADAAESAAYSPSLDNILPSAVRFDFRGRLLPPRLASQIPPTKGLHHHGTAPEAAGYTIPELAHLSRSSFPSQRCIAYQTLGRILYRLGTGVFGPEDHELCQGLWKCIEQGRVLDTLTTEAARDGDSGNRSCWVIATEAVWLWRKGGGRKWKAT
ncbi:MAG: hypothetical protein L6R40_004435 [Gallowayella cf. fulva]|nr:MAG: hypothetical protein L6R40_004435 [Xanthomendoza cf. fulva]